MTAWTPIPFVGGAYKDDSLSFSAQDSLNCFPEPAERQGTRSIAKLKQAPGSTLFSVLGESPIRGLHDCEGLAVALCGSTLYTCTINGTPIARGTIPGVGRVSMAHNQISFGNEVVIANGQSGYVLNTKTMAVTQITDAGFPGAKVVRFVDGYIAGVDPSGRYWFISDLADATSYNTLDRSEAEAQPDRITTLEVSHREIFVFGERSFEIYANTGAATGTFQRIDGAVGEIGCPSTFGAATIDNTVCFIGHDGSFYVMQGYQPVRISTYSIEQAWAGCNLSQAVVQTFEDRGHKIVYITMFDGRTWGYDFATQEWHRRGSQGLNFWRMAHLIRWGRRWLMGDYATGKLYLNDWLSGNEAGAVIERRRIGPVLHADGNRLSVDALRIFADTGRKTPTVPEVVLASLGLFGDLDNGPIGEEVSFQYEAAGGTFPRTFSIVSGSLPAGLSMNASGLVTGTRTLTGSYTWTVRVTDFDGQTADLADASTTTPYAITGDVADGTASIPTAGSYSADGGLEPITYAVTSGTFPTGLTLASDGTWSGTPSAGTYGPWTVAATDSVGNTATLIDSATFSAIVTFDTVRKSSNAELTNGNRDMQLTLLNKVGNALSVIKSTGKWYVEFELLQANGASQANSIIVWTRDDLLVPVYNSYSTGATVFEARSNGTYSNAGSMTLTGGPTFSAVNSVIGVAFDAATRKVWLRNASGWAGGGDPALGTVPMATLDLGTGNVTVAFCFNYVAGFHPKVQMNAGQDAFAYAIPSGFSALSA